MKYISLILLFFELTFFSQSKLVLQEKVSYNGKRERVTDYKYDSLDNLIMERNENYVTNYIYNHKKIIEMKSTRISDGLTSSKKYLYGVNDKLISIQLFDNNSILTSIDIIDESSSKKTTHSHYFKTGIKYNVTVEVKNKDTLELTNFTPLNDGEDASFDSYFLNYKNNSYSFQRKDTLVEVIKNWETDCSLESEFCYKKVKKSLFDKKKRLIYSEERVLKDSVLISKNIRTYNYNDDDFKMTEKVWQENYRYGNTSEFTKAYKYIYK